MLQSFREKILGPFAQVLLGLIILTFAVWGIQGYFSYGENGWVAKVDGDPITVGQFRSEYQQQLARFQQMFGAQYRPELFDTQTAREQFVEQMVRRMLVEKRTRDEVYRVGDAQLAAEIQKLEFFQVDGAFSPQVYAQKLASINMSKSEFEQRLRRDMLLAQLPDAVSGSEFVTDAELARAIALEDEQRAATWIQVPITRVLGQVQLAPAELEAWYAAHKAQFMTEEAVDLEYLELTPATLPPAAAPTDEQLRDLYAAEKDRFVRPEERSARHILLDATDKAKAEALARELMQRIAKGEDFAKLAEKYSTDPGTASSGGDLGWFGRGAMVGAFEDAVFSMKEGEVRGPIASEFGIHIVRLDGVRAEQAKPFEEVRADLAARWSADQAGDAFGKATERLADLVYSNSDSLLPAAEALGLKVMRVADVTRAGGAEVAVEQKVRDAAFSVDVLGERRNSAPIEIDAERVVVIRVAEHRPSAQRPYAEVADAVLDAAREERAGQMAQSLADEVAGRLREGAIPEVVARDAKLAAPQARMVKRSDRAVPAEIVGALFGAGHPDGKPLAGVVALATGDRMVFRIDAVIPGRIEAVSGADLASRREQAARRRGTIALTAYTAALESAANVEYQKDKAQ